MKKYIKISLCVLAVAFVLAAIVGIYAYQRINQTFQGPEAVRIYVPQEATAEQLRDSLVAGLGDFGGDVYEAWHLQKGRPGAAHGSYVVRPGDRIIDVSRRLKYGEQTPLRVSFSNVRRLDELAARVGTQLEFSADDFLAACDSVLPPMGFNKQTYVAAFFPDTYEFYWTTPAEKVVNRLVGERNAFWSDERRAQAAAKGLTPVQVATLASIVEEETAKRDERGKVARLYLNRLDRGMLLQADPTVKFAVGDFGLRRILKAHLDVNSPYNTYKNIGLPPGPIRMPERRTLEAVLDAPRHNYIYMCAKSDFSGYHDFAADYNTHLANAARYRQELNRRGIK